MLEPEAFLADVVELAREECADVIMPSTEITTSLLARNRNSLPAGCKLAAASARSIDQANDKALVLKHAEVLSIPAPVTVFVASPSAPHEWTLPFPVVVKPARSRIRTSTGWESTTVGYAHDAKDLSRLTRSIPERFYPLLLQERIPGHGLGVFAAFRAGTPVALFAHRRLREKPPSGGVSVLCESVPLSEAPVDPAMRLLKELRWEGPAMVEFKHDERDGSFKLMEINGRLWGSLQLAIDAGIDFPGILLAIATNANVAAATDYRSGVRLRWLAGDMDGLMMQLTRSRRKLHLGARHPGRLRTLWDFLKLAQPATRFETERSSDPGPGLLEWRRRLLRY